MSINDRSRPVVVFDLDGTLVDTAPDLIAALNHSLTRQGLNHEPLAAVGHLAGRGAAVMIERALQRQGVPATQDRRAAMLKDFLDHYRAHVADHSRPFPGARDALLAMKAQGHRLAVCTNKPIALAMALLDALELSFFFQAVLGGDSLAVKKPDPTHLIETVRRAGGTPPFAIMIGDSQADVGAAKAAMMPVVAVSFGYSDRPARDLGADHVIDHFDALPALVARLAVDSWRA